MPAPDPRAAVRVGNLDRTLDAGQRFGKLTVLSSRGRVGQTTAWECLCDCGVVKVIRGCNLRSGSSRSCGCGRTALKHEMVGRQFGRLTVKAPAGRYRRDAKWECTCACGATTLALGTHLRSGNTQSCGCLQRDKASARATHGHTRESAGWTPEYSTWSGMVQRCTNPLSSSYYCYGGRGIQVCSRWRESFSAFLEDMGTKPTPEHSLDRIDNDGNYGPGNCRWATAEQQRANKHPWGYHRGRA